MAVFALLTGALVAGAGLTILAARTAWPGPVILTVSLAVAAALSLLYWAGSDQALPSTAFALAAGAGASAAAVDARHQLLPDAGAGLIALGGIIAAVSRADAVSALIAAMVSAGILIIAGLLTRRRGKPASLGQGDVLLAGACGLWVAPEHVPYALLGATVLTAGAGLASGALRGAGPGRMAFGPGLAAGYGVSATASVYLSGMG